MKELMIKENDLVEVHSSPYLPLNKSKGVVLQVFPYLKMAIVSFPLEVKHYEADVDETYTYHRWFLPYKNLKVIESSIDSYGRYISSLEEQIHVNRQCLEMSEQVREKQSILINKLIYDIEQLRKDGNEPQYL